MAEPLLVNVVLSANLPTKPGNGAASKLRLFSTRAKLFVIKLEMLRLYWVLPLALNASVALTVKVAVPDVVGVPAIRPVVLFSDSPAGKAPAEML